MGLFDSGEESTNDEYEVHTDASYMYTDNFGSISMETFIQL